MISYVYLKACAYIRVFCTENSLCSRALLIVVSFVDLFPNVYSFK